MSIGERPAFVLNEGHKRILSITFRMVEQGMQWIQELLLKKDMEGNLYSVVDDLDCEVRDELLSFTRRVMEAVDEFKQAFLLNDEVVEKSRLIAGRLTHLWTILLQTTSQHLRGYGEVPHSFAEGFDPRIEMLAQWMLEMETLVRRRTGLK